MVSAAYIAVNVAASSFGIAAKSTGLLRSRQSSMVSCNPDIMGEAGVGITIGELGGCRGGAQPGSMTREWRSRCTFSKGPRGSSRRRRWRPASPCRARTRGEWQGAGRRVLTLGLGQRGGQQTAARGIGEGGVEQLNVGEGGEVTSGMSNPRVRPCACFSFAVCLSSYVYHMHTP